jgi:hypothetical protein
VTEQRRGSSQHDKRENRTNIVNTEIEISQDKHRDRDEDRRKAADMRGLQEGQTKA